MTKALLAVARIVNRLEDPQSIGNGRAELSSRNILLGERFTDSMEPLALQAQIGPGTTSGAMGDPTLSGTPVSLRVKFSAAPAAVARMNIHHPPFSPDKRCAQFQRTAARGAIVCDRRTARRQTNKGNIEDLQTFASLLPPASCLGQLILCRILRTSDVR